MQISKANSIKKRQGAFFTRYSDSLISPGVL